MKNNVKFIIWLISLWSFSGDMYCQFSNRIHEQLRFKYITIDEGLTNNRVRGMSQDNYGFIWFGTRFGVTRFDGYNLKQYIYYYNDTAEKELTETRGVFCDNAGKLWIVGNYGICYLDWNVDRFIEFRPDIFSGGSIRTGDVKEDDQHNLWFATAQGLLKYHYSDNTMLLYSQDDSSITSIPSGSLDKLEILDNNIWYGISGNGVGYLNRETGIAKHFKSTDDPNTPAEDRVERLYKDKNDNIWVGHYNNGMSKYSYTTGKFTRVFPDPEIKESGRVRGITEDARGNMWVGTQAGLYLMDKNTGKLKRYAYAEHPISILSHNSIQTMMVDNQEGLWLGTFAGGVSYTNLNNSGFIKYEYSNIKSDYYLNDKIVYSLVFDKDENIWAGTENGGINFLDRNSGKFTFFQHDPENRNTVSSNNIKDMVFDTDNNLWIATYRGSLCNYNPEIKKFTYFKESKENPDGLIENTVYSLVLDKVNPHWLWVGGESTLFLYDIGKNKFIHIEPNVEGFSNTPDFSRVNALYIGPDNSVIIGSNKIAVLNRSNNTFDYFTQVNGINISSTDFLLVDKNKNLWAGINNNILFRKDAKTNDIKIYNHENGLPRANLLEIADDKEGDIWLSSNQGIIRLKNIINNPDTLIIDQYDKSDNLQSLEFMYHSKAESISGEVLFGGINGFNSFIPENVKPNPFVPNVIVTKLTIAGQEVRANDKISGKVILRKPIMETKKLRFNYKIKVFTFHFTGFHYVAPENNKFKYMLEGYDDNWHYTDASIRNATYSNIPRGNYVFKVDGTNNNGTWSNKPFTVAIKITPPFWKTLWFYALVAAVIAFLVYLFIKWREQQLKQDKEILEDKLKKGQEEIDKSKSEVARQADELRKRDIAERVQRWHNTGMIKISEIITRNKNDLNELSKSFLRSLIDYLNAQQGTIYILNDDDQDDKFLEFLTGYGLGKKRLKQKRIDIGENLIGVCFKDKETMLLDHIPKDYTEIKTGIGNTKPYNIVLIPVKQDEVIMGVLEVASLEKIEDYMIKFIETISEAFASNLFTSKTGKRMTELLQRTQQQTEELQSQEEEMRQNMEEMMATQDEASRKENELMELNEKLIKREDELQNELRKKNNEIELLKKKLNSQT